MTAETKYGTGYADPTAFPTSVIEGKLKEGVLKSSLSHVQITAAAETASQYYLTSVPSNCIPRFDSTLYHDAASTSVTLDIVVANPSTSSTAMLADDLDISSAGSKLMLADVDDPANGGKELWDLAGFASDPGLQLDIYAELGSGGTAAATDLTADFRYSIVG